jgi:hypothetical protein
MNIKRITVRADEVQVGDFIHSYQSVYKHGRNVKATSATWKRVVSVEVGEWKDGSPMFTFYVREIDSQTLEFVKGSRKVNYNNHPHKDVAIYRDVTLL